MSQLLFRPIPLTHRVCINCVFKYLYNSIFSYIKHFHVSTSSAEHYIYVYLFRESLLANNIGRIGRQFQRYIDLSARNVSTHNYVASCLTRVSEDLNRRRNQNQKKFDKIISMYSCRPITIHAGIQRSANVKGVFILHTPQRRSE